MTWLTLMNFSIEELRAATVTVTNALDDTGTGNGVSLREAITSMNNGANLNADVVATGTYGSGDMILFDIGGGGLQTISVNGSQLPPLDTAVLIDGNSQPNFAGTPLIDLDGLSAGAAANGFVLTNNKSHKSHGDR